MSYFDKIKNKRPDRFTRQVGISLVDFENLMQQLKKKLGNQQKNPLKRLVRNQR
jgi:hypothetical protein